LSGVALNVMKFSDDGALFAAVKVRDNTDSDEVGDLLVHRAGDGAVVEGFRPVPGRWDTVVEFSRDNGSFVTESWNSSTGVAVRRWSAKSGEPLPGPAGEFRRRDGAFLGFARFGEFCLTLPPGQLDGDYTAITLRRVDEGLTPLVTLRFADHGTAALAAALFRAAKEIRPAGAEGVVAVLDSGVEVSATNADAGGALTHGRTKRRLVPPLDSGADLSKLVLSPDGRLVAAIFREKEKSQARVWDAATGLPLSERLWHENAVASLAFSPDGRRLMTATVRGVLRTWYFGDFAGGAPSWAAHVSEALGGLHVAGGVDVQRLSSEEHARSRREFVAELERAAAAGDEAARFLLAGLRR
jgi:hypothetical protein